MRSQSLPSHHHHHSSAAFASGYRSVSFGQFVRPHHRDSQEDAAADVPFLDSSRPGNSGLDLSPVLEMRGTTETLGVEVVHTLKEAIFQLLRFHILDWLAILGLVILDGVLNIIQPFYRFVGDTMIGDYKYPLKANTIPFQAVPVIAVVIPLIFIVGYFFYKRDITDLHHAVLVAITAVITDAVKDAVGRPRPDFFWRCFPNGVDAYNNVTGEVQCSGDPSIIKEGHKSFPSGHTSWSFAGLGFLSLYLAGKIQIFNHRGHVAKLALVFTPILGALLVGLSRIDDYWHHWQDVFVGAFLGLAMAFFCYHQFFPLLHDINSMGPYTHLQIGTNFHFSFVPWLRHRRTRNEDWPPDDSGRNHDTEDGRTGHFTL